MNRSSHLVLKTLFECSQGGEEESSLTKLCLQGRLDILSGLSRWHHFSRQVVSHLIRITSRFSSVPSLEAASSSHPTVTSMLRRFFPCWELPRLGRPGLLSDWTAATRGAVTAGWGKYFQRPGKSSACPTSQLIPYVPKVSAESDMRSNTNQKIKGQKLISMAFQIDQIRGQYEAEHKPGRQS